MAGPVDDYITAASKDVRPKLIEMRAIIRQATPEAEEVISYGIPTYKLGGKNLIHFGAGKHHVGLYATPSGHSAFSKELSKYKQGKGSVQFPLDEPLPVQLIQRITQYRIDTLTKGV